MKILNDSPNIDFSSTPHINRVLYNGQIYVIETEADYADLPQPVKDVLFPPDAPPV